MNKSCYVDFVPFIRDVRVLSKRRLILSRINGPNVEPVTYCEKIKLKIKRRKKLIPVMRPVVKVFFLE